MLGLWLQDGRIIHLHSSTESHALLGQGTLRARLCFLIDFTPTPSQKGKG